MQENFSGVPRTLKEEIGFLYELGVEIQDLEFLMYEKIKEEISIG
jgi:hypothetical protein